jgi:hypothetical protein
VGRRYALAPSPGSTLLTKVIARTTMRSRATIWPRSGLRATILRRPSGEISVVTKDDGFWSPTPPTPRGTKNQKAA